MTPQDDEAILLQSVALQTAQSILLTRQRAEEELVRAKEALEKRTEELEHTLSMMRATLESTTDGILVTDEQGRITDFNEKFVEMFQIPRDTIDSRQHEKLRELLSRQIEDSSRYNARIDSIYASSAPETFDVLELVDGRAFERFSRIQIVRDKAAGRVWSFRDITERRRSERRLSLALAAGRLGAWQFDVDTDTLTATPQCKANHGLPPDADIQFERDVIEPIFAEHQDRFRSAIRLAIETNGSFEIEVPNIWPDGTSHWLLVCGLRMDRSSLVGVSVDVTERQRTQKALQESEERLHTLADNMAQLAWMADPDGSIFWYNRRWCEYTGATPEEMLARGWKQAHHPDHAAAAEEKLRHCFDSGEPWEDTFLLQRKDGVFRWFLSRALPIHDEHGNIIRWFGTHTDVTERRLAELALLEADRRKDEFLAVVAHELRSPMAAVLMAAQVLQRRGPADPTLQKMREAIVRQTTQLTNLVEDLLDVGRIATGKLRLEKTLMELNPILTQAAEAAAPVIERHHHTLNVSLADPPIYLNIDPGRIVQVFSNLLNNAAKFMKEAGRIDVLAFEEAGNAVVRVRDEGIGIPEEMLGRIFQRFVQMGTSGRAEGLGIGLSIVSAVVEMHGGTVEAASRGIGKGSEFTVRLPCVKLASHTQGVFGAR